MDDWTVVCNIVTILVSGVAIGLGIAERWPGPNR